MATAQQWIAGARPRTLPMAVAPVLIGTAAALAQPTTSGWFAYAPLAETTYSPWDDALWLLTAVLALVVSLALQVGVNYANDYSDGVRGTDDARVGPMRLTASGAAAPGRVKAAAFASFGVAAIAGLGIVVLTQAWWLIAVGVVCILAAWAYTGGSRPYGYLGLGEVMVFIFFGIIATVGTAYSVVETAAVRGAEVEVGSLVWVGAVSHGLIASALLMANNIRDIPTDRQAGKMTLAVRLGETRARWAYAAMIAAAVMLPVPLVLLGPQSPWFLLVMAAWPLCLRPIATVTRRSEPTRGPELIPVLQQTSVMGMAFAVTFSAALLLS
ncbi:1,4-dihydroxy-2-naphthoate polyprenyltransferase [Nesterenkonia alba]|uniref:1,4-dihydroxy-2-naphthoate polyprenyltransferase n=1 Tax=Nesterenkonia alba TaxID=515814 RepID=UPI0003B68012|nr:1,4-dihydroxy-2-naphthoate polyprenyltransferase [Nesterenkonia alba]